MEQNKPEGGGGPPKPAGGGPPKKGPPKGSGFRVLRGLLYLAAIGSAIVHYIIVPAGVADSYLRNVFPILARGAGTMASPLPIPASFVIEAGLVVAAAAWLLSRLVHWVTGRETFGEAIGRTVWLGVDGVALAMVVFVWGGGILADLPPIEQRASLDDSVDPSDFVDAAEEVASDLVDARRALPEIPGFITTSARDWRAGTAGTEFPLDHAAFEEASRRAIHNAVRALEGREFDTFFPARAPYPDTFLHRMGVSGESWPPLGEVLVSPYVSAIVYGAVLPHEMAHAAGIVREREAELYAFVGGAASNDPFLRYCVLRMGLERLIDAAEVAGEGGARADIEDDLPDDILKELQDHWSFERLNAFAPGGSVVRNEDGTYAVTSGTERGAWARYFHGSVGTAVGLPPDYDEAARLIALWVLKD